MNRNVRNTRARKPVRPDARHSAKRRRRKKRGSAIPVLVALVFCALAMIPVVKVLTSDVDKPASAQTAYREAEAVAPAATAAPEVTAQPEITFVPQATEAPTPEPTPSPEPTPEPTATPTPEPTPFAYLPVVHSAEIEQKKIAITVDDCYQVNNLTTIVGVAEKNGGKLTLFPVGENLSKDGMPALLQRCASSLGFEIENHTWSHARIFRLSDEEMAAEIWKQDAALNKALGVNYQEHFLRLMGGDGDTDPRIHSYLEQLGYLGIANWSVSGSDSDMKHIKASLAPGQVYLFHCTDPDTKKLKEFIPWAVSQGYQLVTLNELFNLPANEVSELSESAMPAPEADVDDHHTLTEGEYTWVALQLQEKLRASGYLVFDGPSTGYYGPQTVKAVKKFQQDHGLEVTGEADLVTQQAILAS